MGAALGKEVGRKPPRPVPSCPIPSPSLLTLSSNMPSHGEGVKKPQPRNQPVSGRSGRCDQVRVSTYFFPRRIWKILVVSDINQLPAGEPTVP